LQEFTGEVKGLVRDVKFSFRRPVILCPWPLSCPRSEFQAVPGVAEEDGGEGATTDLRRSFLSLLPGVGVRVVLVNVRKYSVIYEKIYRIRLSYPEFDYDDEEEEEEEDDYWDRYGRYDRYGYHDEEESNSKKGIIHSDESQEDGEEEGVRGLKLTISNIARQSCRL
jgi:hypothetical protein